MATKELLHKFAHSCEAITDEELEQLHSYFTALNKALDPCPAEYQLTLQDVFRRLDRINDMKTARESGRRWAASYQRVTPQLPQISVRA